MNFRTAAFIAAAFICAFQFGTWLFIKQHPDFAADEIIKRSTLGYALIYDLKWKWFDSESDLTSPVLTRDMVIEACENRARIAMFRMGFLPFIVAAGLLIQRNRTQSQT